MKAVPRRSLLQCGTVLAAALSFQPDIAGAAPTSEPRRIRGIDAALLSGAARNDVAGVVAMAATQKGLVYKGAFGPTDVAVGTLMSPDTVFWLLSMTKAFTATACMQLVEQGRIELDDAAAKYLPNSLRRMS